MKYYSKGSEVEATKWCKNGDHPLDESVLIGHSTEPYFKGSLDVVKTPFLSEGKIVRRFRLPNVAGDIECTHCDDIMNNHGWIDGPRGGETVCPGDFIIQSDDGHFYPCKSETFKAVFND